MKRALFLMAAALSLGAWAGSVQVLVLDKEGKPTADAVVTVLPAGAGTPKKPLPQEATVSQEKMQFIPAVTVVPVGAKVRFVNNDAWDHQVRGTADGMAQFTNTGSSFDLRLDGKPDGKPAKSGEVVFDKPGVVLLTCLIHNSMRGNVYVASSAWTAKTGADGVAVFDDVPDGAAQLKVWQSEQLIEVPAQAITVSAMPLKATLHLTVVPRRRRA
jgi:plastocyanin